MALKGIIPNSKSVKDHLKETDRGHAIQVQYHGAPNQRLPNYKNGDLALPIKSNLEKAPRISGHEHQEDDVKIIPSHQGKEKSKITKHSVSTLQRRDIGYKLNPSVFAYLKDIFEDTYGFFLTRDVFADRKRSLLDKEGFPNAAASKDNAVYIDANWDQLNNVLKWLDSAKVVALIIVPDFQKHTWFINLQRGLLIISVGDGLFVKKDGGESPPPARRSRCTPSSWIQGMQEQQRGL